MATTGYFMITVKDEFYQNYYQSVLGDLKAVPEVDFIQRISGTHNLLVRVTAPMRLIFVANKILPNKWIKQFCILKVEPFNPRDYEGFTVDELAKLGRLIPKPPARHQGLTLEDRLRINRLIHGLGSIHRAVYISP